MMVCTVLFFLLCFSVIFFLLHFDQGFSVSKIKPVHFLRGKIIFHSDVLELWARCTVPPHCTF